MIYLFRSAGVGDGGSIFDTACDHVRISEDLRLWQQHALPAVQ
jgi:hypothetical protein